MGGVSLWRLAHQQFEVLLVEAFNWSTSLAICFRTKAPRNGSRSISIGRPLAQWVDCPIFRPLPVAWEAFQHVWSHERRTASRSPLSEARGGPSCDPDPVYLVETWSWPSRNSQCDRVAKEESTIDLIALLDLACLVPATWRHLKTILSHDAPFSLDHAM